MALRWGVVSAGKISHDFVTALGTLPTGNHTVVAVAAKDSKRANDFALLHNIKYAYDSYELLAKNTEIDVVYIGSLNPDHFDHIIMMLNHGKHVLCEKPMCMNSKQVRQAVDLARSKSLFLMEAVWSRFFPAYEKLQAEIEAGALGEVKFVNVLFGIAGLGVRVRKRSLGGSLILDLGVYGLQFAQFVFKESPTRVIASGFLNDEAIDKSASIVLQYGGDRTAVISLHSEVNLANTASVVGTKGSTDILKPFWCPTQIRLSDGSVEEYSLPVASHQFNYTNSSGLSYEAEEVRRCIKAGLTESPRMSLDQSLELAKLEDEIRAALGVHFDVDD